MTVHHTPRMVLQVLFRRADRLAHAPTKARRVKVGMAAERKIRNPEAYATGKEFNEKHNLGYDFYKKKHIKGYNLNPTKKKPTMPKTNMKDPEE